MKRHLNTLFVTTQNSYLSREGETVIVRAEEEIKLRVPIHNIGGIICFGLVGASPALMGLCGERGVALSFFSEYGRFLARVQGPVSGNVLLRREQYRRADSKETSATVARAVVAGKIVNCRTVLQRALRDHPALAGEDRVKKASDDLNRLLRKLRDELPLDTARGIEGDAGRIYFNVFDHLITSQKEDFPFTKRTRRPPLDNINALMSFLYTILMHDVMSALEGVGLDPAVGFLHRDRPGRPGLALDLMEEFRPFLADRMTLSLINRKQVQPSGFVSTESGGIHMDDDTRKEVLVAWQKRKQETIRHPFLEEQTTVGLLLHLQALLLSRWLRDDLDGYPPFVWK
jgi:CRISPR-associated protein Cas1